MLPKVGTYNGEEARRRREFGREGGRERKRFEEAKEMASRECNEDSGFTKKEEEGFDGL